VCEDKRKTHVRVLFANVLLVSNVAKDDRSVQ
jgi:hypothetical protein